tara:strand:- start:1282 stop:2973 length:1692 start_codon:yes stop_codon:yes gene_type:complete
VLYRILFFLIFSQSFSQLKIDSIYDYKLIELNNIGTVFNSHFPNFDFDIIDVNYNIIGSRLVENYDYNLLYNNINIIPISNITSNLSYISSYNEGGLIMCNLQRPMSKKSFINFYYNNLSSKGFFQYQENKFSNLGLEFYSFNQDTTYRFQFGFNSINGFYKENGGIQSYNSNLSNDLLSTYLNSATIENQIRNFLFSHIFKINSKNSIRHTFKYNRYNRLYNDPNPTSFHYSMTPLSFEILSYNRSNYFHDIENSLHFNSEFFFKKKIDYSLIHRLYYNDLIVNKKYGDFIFSVSNLNNKLSKYNFSVSFCPIGYNKNNYDFRFYYKFDYNERIKNKFSISLNKQKPNLFLENYDTGLSIDWENDFAPTNVFSINLETYLSKYNFDIKLNYKKISDLLYYNNIAAPVQFNESIRYLHFHLKKDWFLNRLRINHNIHFQKVKHNDSNFDIIPIPVFLLNQKVTYDFSLFKKIDFSSSFDLTLFSKYYANSYMPINGVFYNQNELKIGGRPLLQASLFMKKKNFNIGVLVENIHSLFFDELYIIPDYIYNNLVFRLSLDWRFLD